MATEEQLTDIEEQIVADAEAGMANVTVDGMNVGMVPLKDRLDALDRLNRRSVTNPFSAMRPIKLVSPGGGG